jgi:Dullard-like phosphatase family protein
MKPVKSPRNVQFRISSTQKLSAKLTIDLPVEDENPEFFNKNSPVSKKVVTEIQKNSGVFAPKHKKNSIGKKVFTEGQKPTVFKFPPTPKVLIKRPVKTVVHRSNLDSKGKVLQKKFSVTPTTRQVVEGPGKRPSTATNAEKVKLKPETGSSPLTSFVTQVKQNKTKQFKFPVQDNQQDTDDKKSEILYKEHLFQTFQAMKFVRTLQPVNIDQLREKRVSVPRRKGFELKKTLIFDLDETLVHCCEDVNFSSPSVILPIVFPSGETIEAGINIRPFALDCLREVSKYFEVFVFTASHQCYANVVLDHLDPKHELIHHRFFRDSCVNMNGVFIKDLRIFANRNLKDMIIVDNAAYSFAYQLENGIPIVSWHDDPNDRELMNLIDYVKALASVDDVREINDATFRLRTFYEDYINEFLANDKK